MPNIDNEPLALDEVKKALHVAAALHDHDEDIEELIIAVRKEAETLIGAPIISTVTTQYWDKWPTGETDLDWWDGVRDGAIGAGDPQELVLKPGNLISVTSLALYGEDDEKQEIPTTVYFSDIYSDQNRLVLRSGQSWPTSIGNVLSMRTANGIEAIYTLGWASRAATPKDLRERMKERCVQRWRVRGDAAAKKNAIDWLFYGPYTQLKFGRDNL